MNRRAKVFALTGSLLIVLTLFLFLVITRDRITITWLGLATILLAECVSFGGYILIEKFASSKEQIVLRSGGGTTLTIYALVSIIISIVFMSLRVHAVRSFIAIQAIIFVAMLVLVVVFYTAATSAKESNRKVVDSLNRCNNMVQLLRRLKDDNRNVQYYKLLDKLEEELRFTDISTTVKSDDELENKITELELALLKEVGSKDDEVNSISADILRLIHNRKLEVSNMKVGGI